MKINYTGYDAYKNLIDYHNKTYKPYTEQYRTRQNRYIKNQDGILILNENLFNMTFKFVHADFTTNPENINSADLCIIKDVLQHLPNCMIEKFMEYITQSHKFKYILIINCYNTTSENTKDYRKDIKPGEFSSLSAFRYPLNKDGGEVIYTWDTKEVSLITL